MWYFSQCYVVNLSRFLGFASHITHHVEMTTKHNNETNENDELMMIKHNTSSEI
jgi:hypothetical protein